MPKTIKMLKDTRVSPNGHDVETWLKGQMKENVRDDVADDLTHEQTLAAIEVTGDRKADAESEKDALDEMSRRADEAAAAVALKGAAEKAALEAAKGAQAPKAPRA